MISKISCPPEALSPLAETVKIRNLFLAYQSEIQLLRQTETGAVISLLDGNAIISGGVNAAEVKSFLSFVKPKSVFSSMDNLTSLYGEGAFESLNVIICKKPPLRQAAGYLTDISSREAFDILSAGGFELPGYEYFATDFCRYGSVLPIR